MEFGATAVAPARDSEALPVSKAFRPGATRSFARWMPRSGRSFANGLGTSSSSSPKETLSDQVKSLRSGMDAICWQRED